MADIVITITVNGIQEVNANLTGAIDRSADLTPVMKQSAVLMMGSINENFQQGGRPAPWFPLALSTIKQKVRQGYSVMPLIRTGTLRASITPRVGQTSFKLGTSIVYGRIHQKGGKAGRNHSATIPARPYLVFQDEDLRQINRLVSDYIRRGV